MDVVIIECPSCGARLPPAEATGEYVCDYCGERFLLRQARRATTVTGKPRSVEGLARAVAAADGRTASEGPNAEEAPKTAPLAAAATAARAAIVAAALATLLGLGAAVAVAWVVLSDDARALVTGLIEKAAASYRSLLWDDVGGLPEPVTIDGRPAVLGRTRDVRDGDALFVDAFDLETGDRIWRIADLGSYGQALHAVRFGVVGPHVVVTDAQARLHVHDLATGMRVRTIPLTDRASYVCTPRGAMRTAGLLPQPPADARHLAWIEVVDGRNFFLDPSTGATTEAPRPPWCARSAADAMALGSGKGPNGVDRRRYAEKLGVPEVAGVEIVRPFVASSRAVALGVASPGTPVPKALGYVPGEVTPTWVTVVADVSPASIRSTPPMAALDDDRFVVVYGVGQDGWRMTALDPSTGDRLWSRDLERVFAVDDVSSVTLAGDDVLLVHSTALEVYDGATGERRRILGSIEYE
ncbi:MAG: hypothetical protein D6705_00470 [Deltaproteobacteria bacterium]|nr:MAG: hypothetical protein D6705_00470 [Deltaproteobacteria bacterium]